MKTNSFILTHALDLQDEAGWTILHHAAFQGDIEAVEELLEAGAELSIVNYDGETALDIAYNRGCTQIIELLLQYYQTPQFGLFEKRFAA